MEAPGHPKWSLKLHPCYGKRKARELEQTQRAHKAELMFLCSSEEHQVKL